nr:KilA-N domain-containing protein [Photorhabdus australis]
MVGCLLGLVFLCDKGYPIRFNDEGWINATLAADKFEKYPNDWLRLPETSSYIQALERRYGKIPYVKTSRARKDRGGGTWLHPRGLSNRWNIWAW